ncbi:MAG: ribonuclease R [Alphaproteobacteria bacterium]|nr:ribonuclease R [Alphaproteobacteria bacterium]
MPKDKAKTSATFPSREEVLRFIHDSPDRSGKREIARAFGISGTDRMRLKRLLRELGDEGLIARGRRRSSYAAGGLPPVTVIEITGIDIDGELYARPTQWNGETEPPRIIVTPGQPDGTGLAPGNRALAKLRRTSDGFYEARVIRRLPDQPDEILGVYNLVAGHGRIVPTDRRIKREFVVAGPDSLGAYPGEVVLAETLRGTRLGLGKARVVERLGSFEDPRSYSLIAIRNHGIPITFSAAALAEAEAATPVPVGRRRDLRHLPLITIDPADARDHDDAVWAVPDDDPGNPGGWKIVVAIADVAAYVRPGSALDTDARERGNSVYFPDRVVPMLPEALSSDLCSLKAGVDRACLAAFLWIDADGNPRRHEFVRGMMRAAANLTYRSVQHSRDDGYVDDVTMVLDPVISNLYGAYATLRCARERRQPLDIELPELRVVLGGDGHVESVKPRGRWDSHRLIEEFMIAANVATAETLQDRDAPCMYRVHERPEDERVEALRALLARLDLRLAKGQAVKAEHFNRILRQVAATPHARLVNEVVLRTQTQAFYSLENSGHFGLNLRRYAHFTSPIRRYADLLVHRGLITALGIGDDGLAGSIVDELPGLGDRISAAERRAMAAEREALDRYLAAYLELRRGATFTGRISGVTRFGLFVTLDGVGADGLVPVRTLGDDFYIHDETRHALVGERTGTTFSLGSAIDVRLVEADTVTGSLRLELIEEKGPFPPLHDRRRQVDRTRRVRQR